MVLTSGVERSTKVVVYAGGFSKDGGIEQFIADLLTSFPLGQNQLHLVCWGAKSATLSKIRGAGIRVSRVPWRWGCRWSWPDTLLLCFARRFVRTADFVLFGKLFKDKLQRDLASCKLRGAKFIWATPYRPSEMWNAWSPGSDVLSSLDLVIVQSHSFAIDLMQYGYEGDVKVLPYVPPSSIIPRDVPIDSNLKIGYVGRLVRDKNVEFLLDVLAFILRKRPAFLTIIGDGPERLPLIQKARKLGVLKNITLTGFIPRHKLPNLISDCHLFVSASKTEGQCLAALDVLACGRPIVATPVGSLPEILTTRVLGRLVDSSDVSVFASAILETHRDLESGKISPAKIVEHYNSTFDRGAIICEYAGLFSS